MRTLFITLVLSIAAAAVVVGSVPISSIAAAQPVQPNETSTPTPTPASPDATAPEVYLTVDVQLPSGEIVEREVPATEERLDLSGLPAGATADIPRDRLPADIAVVMPNGRELPIDDLPPGFGDIDYSSAPTPTATPESTSAQTPSTSTSTSTPVASSERVSGQVGTNTTYVAAVSPILRIVSFEYDRQAAEMMVLFEADVPNRVLVRDSLTEIESRGFTALPEGRTIKVARGRTRVSVSATPVNGDARIYIEGDQGRGYLSTGMDSDSPFDRTSSAGGWIGGAATMALMGIAAARHQLNKTAAPSEEVEV
jgi:hypothetical protein